MSTVGNNNFFNELGFGLIYSIDDFFRMVTSDYLIIERIDKNNG